MNNVWQAAITGLVQAAQQPVPEMAPGMKTSEFWLTSIGAVAIPVAMSVGQVSPTAAGVSTALIAAYSLARAYTKAAHAKAVGDIGAAYHNAPAADPKPADPPKPVEAVPAPAAQ